MAQFFFRRDLHEANAACQRLAKVWREAIWTMDHFERTDERIRMEVKMIHHLAHYATELIAAKQI